jgi:hypothetical protein
MRDISRILIAATFSSIVAADAQPSCYGQWLDPVPLTCVETSTGRRCEPAAPYSTGMCIPYQLPAPNQLWPSAQAPRQAPAVPPPRSQREPALAEANPALTPVPIKTTVIRRKGKGAQVAPLKIEADNSSYLVKIVDKSSDTEAMLIFIGPNQTFDTKVALGTYRIRGASGDTWYGEKNLFGPSTSFFVLRRSTGASFAGDDEFQFTLTGNTYHGHHIQLRKSVGGNLSTDRIKPEDF